MTREPTWFEQVTPSLLRNKGIREYLQQQPEKDWPEVLKCTILYGIVTLKKQYPGKILHPSELKSILGSVQVASTVEDAIPDIRNELDKLQGQLVEVSGSVPVSEYNPMAGVGTASAAWVQHGYSICDRVINTEKLGRSHNGLRMHDALAVKNAIRVQEGKLYRGPAAKAATDWWKDDSRTWSPPGRKRSPGRECSLGSYQAPAPVGPVYPAWWGDGSNIPPAQKEKAPEKEARPPPRLAYSVQSHPEDGHVYMDDLVTSSYLNVPSSGYGGDPPQSHNLWDDSDSFHFPPPSSAPGAPAQAPPMSQNWAGQGAGGEGGPMVWGGADLAARLPIPVGNLPPATAAAAANHNAAKQAHRDGGGKVKVPASGAPLFALLPSGVMVPVNFDQGQSNEKTKAKPRWTGPNRSNVQSKVKEMVERDKESARMKMEARRRAVNHALGGGSARSSTPRGSVQYEGAAPASQQQSGGGGLSPPSELADRLESSPWTSWFMSGEAGAEPAAGTSAVHDKAGQWPQTSAFPPRAPEGNTPASAYAASTMNPNSSVNFSASGGYSSGRPAAGGASTSHEPPAFLSQMPTMADMLAANASAPIQSSWPGASFPPPDGGSGAASGVPASSQPLGGAQPPPKVAFGAPGLVAGARGVKWEVPLGDGSKANAGGSGAGRAISADRPARAYSGVRPEVSKFANTFPHEDAFQHKAERPAGADMDELVERMKRKLAASVAESSGTFSQDSLAGQQQPGTGYQDTGGDAGAGQPDSPATAAANAASHFTAVLASLAVLRLQQPILLLVLLLEIQAMFPISKPIPRHIPKYGPIPKPILQVLASLTLLLLQLPKLLLMLLLEIQAVLPQPDSAAAHADDYSTAAAHTTARFSAEHSHASPGGAACLDDRV
eukprot:gene23129-30330_t